MRLHVMLDSRAHTCMCACVGVDAWGLCVLICVRGDGGGGAAVRLDVRACKQQGRYEVNHKSTTHKPITSPGDTGFLLTKPTPNQRERCILLGNLSGLTQRLNACDRIVSGELPRVEAAGRGAAAVAVGPPDSPAAQPGALKPHKDREGAAALADIEG